MIPAGTLKYKLLFKHIIKTQSATGAISTYKVDLLSCKAAKVKAKNSSGIDAKEMFNSSIIEFKIRFNKLINTDLIVSYNDCEYKIISVDDNKFDNSISLIVDKINN